MVIFTFQSGLDWLKNFIAYSVSGKFQANLPLVTGTSFFGHLRVRVGVEAMHVGVSVGGKASFTHDSMLDVSRPGKSSLSLNKGDCAIRYLAW